MTLRHQLLRDTAVTVTWSEDGCSVVRGKWIDPYSGRELRDPADIEVDHLIPLAWAWRHGADAWDDERRYAFATDPRFLIPVLDAENRRKGDSDPLEWLPSDSAYHCAYVTRFMRGVLTWDLDLSLTEAADLRRLRQQLCARDEPAS